jgi:hypothetical protein
MVTASQAQTYTVSVAPNLSTVKADNNVTHGVATAGELGVSGPTCKTFLGLKARCSASVGVSVGLQLCAGWGAGWAIGPATAGATAKCCVEVASVKCNVAENRRLGCGHVQVKRRGHALATLGSV